MPIKTIPNTSIPYYLICYDKEGNERHDDPDVTDGILSREIIRRVLQGQYTDIIFSSHGWQAALREAVDQYDRWTASMFACEQDLARLNARPQGFNPLVIGLHWPSLPFGMEEHTAPPQHEVDERNPLFDFGLETATTGNDIYRLAEDTVASTEEGRKAVRTILDYAALNSAPEQLDETVAAAIDYLLTHDVGISGAVGVPVEDALETDANTLYQALKEESEESIPSFGGRNGRGPVLGLVSQLSFWQMKARARTFGENGGAKLLRELLSVTSSDVKFHLMGHSFGTIVVSSTITGQGGQEPLPRPVDTVYLVQGAVSFWSFCEDIPVKAGVSGYYQMLSHPDYVAGPILVTHTENDTAIKTFYVLAAKISFGDTISFDPDFPTHGGLGMFGARGKGIAIHDMSLLPLHGNYGFTPNTFFNLHASNFIREGNPLTGGAHSDIAHPEVFHAFWSAIH